MIRWQLSTPILALIPYFLLKIDITNFWISAFVANLIGSLIFFKIDEYIFSKNLTRFQRLRNKVEKRTVRRESRISFLSLKNNTK
jgi:membrane protein YqaA with SNARE-associated domain